MISLGLAKDAGERPLPAPIQEALPETVCPQPALNPSDGSGFSDVGENPQKLSEQLQAVLGPRFEVVRLAAIGGMATLFELRHRQHGGRLAAKVLHTALRRRDDCVQSFLNEAVHLATLGEHPNLLPLLDCDLEGDLLYMLFPFIEGEDLDRLLAAGHMPREEALHMAAQVSSVLAHMESHAVVHGDISPGNLRLDTFGRYRLLDFGLSRRHGSPPAARGATPLYQSPEQIQGGDPDGRSDLYALGLVLAEALSGTPLMQGETLDAIQAKHLSEQRPLPASVSADVPVARLLHRLIARNAADRFPSAFELSGALAALGYERPEFRPATYRRRRRMTAVDDR